MGEELGTENTVRNSVRVPPQGGLLLTGNPGNRGGSGRPPSAIRAIARDDLEVTLTRIRELVEDPKSEIRLGELCRAADVQGKFGLGEARVMLPDEFIDFMVEELVRLETLERPVTPADVNEIGERMRWKLGG